MNAIGISMSTEILRHPSADASPYCLETSRLELEVAEALAVLAHTDAPVDRCGGEWGSKGKRAKKRVKSECGDTRIDTVNGVDYPCPPVEEDDAQSFAEVKEEKRLIVSPATSSPKRQEEKEARKLRRILANRESARQTIRRRQALCDDLTRRAADLQWENGKLKKEKEAVLEEFQSLEVINKRLKAQMAKVYKFEVVDTHPSLLWNPQSQTEHHPAPAFASYNEWEKTSPFFLFQCPFFFHYQPPVFPKEEGLPVVDDLNEQPLDDEDDYLLTSLALGPATTTPVKEDSAAVARRKRKELTRLKNLHPRHCTS